MSRSETRAGQASASHTNTTPEMHDHERPVPSSDERGDRQDRTDVLQHARQLAHVGEMTAALTTLRAQLLAHKGDVESAIVEMNRALELAPDDVPNLCLRAALCTSRAKYDQAETDLKRAAKLAGFNPDVQVQLGVLFCKRARWREAIEPLRAAIAAEPKHALAYYHLGDAYNSVDDLPAALSAYETAAQLEPRNERPLMRIGVVLDRLGRPAEAAVAYRRARAAQGR